ncbi:MAG: hypothetical protein AAFP09_05020 [Cyanobacteria bacterium J06607_10]
MTLMLTLSDAYGIEFHRQHTLQADDLTRIIHLGEVEGLTEKLETWNADLLFGFACHLFITTEQQQTREQLATLLPKFGPRAVYTLIQLTHLFPATHNIHSLAQQSLEAMPLYPLVIGLADAIQSIEEDKKAEDIMPALVTAIIKLIYCHDGQLLDELSQKVSSRQWQTIETLMLRVVSQTRSNRPSKAQIQTSHLYKVELAQTA